ncbi:MAG: hypothetical protein ACR65R_19925 [Methylomicrobium sp.]
MKNKTNPATLKPDFKHRLSILGDEASPRTVSDAVDNAADQASSLIAMIQGQFLGPEHSDAKLSDEIIHDCLESVYRLVLDMKAIVNAYHIAVREDSK